MTLNYSWLAFRGVEPAVIHARLSLQPTDQRSPSPVADISGANLAGGWHLIFANCFDYADQAPLAELSVGGEVITCCANEATMISSISGWRGGVRSWSFVHDGECGIQHMALEGGPPPEYHTIANHLMIVQAEGAAIDITVDHVFEIPQQVAFALTGFRHDESTCTSGGVVFEKLRENRP